MSLPFALRAPHARASAGVTIAVGAVASALPCYVVYASSTGEDRVMAEMPAFTTPVFAALLLHWVLRGSEPASASVRCLFGAIPAGIVNAWAGLILMLALGHGHGHGDAVIVLCGGLFMGLFVGGGIGLFYGLVLAPLAGFAAWAADRRAHDRLEPVLLGASAWSLLLAFVGHSPLSEALGPHAFRAAVAAPFVLASVAFARDAARLIELRDLYGDRAAGLAVVPEGSLAGVDATALAPLVHASRGPWGYVISRGGDCAPYRETGSTLALARAPLDRDAATKPVLRRLAIAFAITLLAALLCALATGV